MVERELSEKVKKSTEEVRIIRLPELQRKLGNVGKATVYRMMEEERIPQNFKIGKRASGWLESDVDAAILIMREEGA